MSGMIKQNYNEENNLRDASYSKDPDSASHSSKKSVTEAVPLPFKKKKTFEQRLTESNNIKSRFPNKIPIIVEKYSKETTLPPLDKTKYLVPQELSLSQFIVILRNRMDLKEGQAIYLLVNDKSMVTMSSPVSQIYDSHKDPDGFLYMTYASQETFG